MIDFKILYPKHVSKIKENFNTQKWSLIENKTIPISMSMWSLRDLLEKVHFEPLKESPVRSNWIRFYMKFSLYPTFLIITRFATKISKIIKPWLRYPKYCGNYIGLMQFFDFGEVELKEEETVRTKKPFLHSENLLRLIFKKLQIFK